MALIGKIRRQKWLLIGSLAAALALFILMLMFDNPNQSFFGGSQTLVGEIEGRKVEYQEFNQTHDMLYRNSGSDGLSDRTFLWNYFVDEAIVKNEAEAIGIGVSRPELVNLQFSDDNSRLSPIITSRYRNPNTQQLDRNQLNQLRDVITTGQVDQMIRDQQLVPDFKYRWAHQEKEIIKDRLQTKMANMVSKAIYTPSWMAEMISEDQNQRIDFLYVQVPYDEIENSEVALSEEDYEEYFEEHKSLFEQDEETRKVEFVTFEVLPSAEDSAEIRKTVADLVPRFETEKNDSLFVENNYGSLDPAYLTRDALSSAIADTVFELPIGTVYGPYIDANSYKAVKILDRKIVPDSVSARHILRRASDLNTLRQAQNTIDSIKLLIESGASTFEEMAQALSEDQSNAGKGGDLGTFGPGTMVKPFNDLVFYEAEPGKVYSVVTQFGVHLVEVTDRQFVENEEGVKLAYISQDIYPSQATQDEVRERALVLQENSEDLEQLRKNAVAEGLDVETSPSLKANDYTVGTLGAGQGSRELVRWAFGVDQNMTPPEVGDVSPQVYSFQNAGEFHVSKYVVAALSSKREAGIPGYEAVKTEIEPMVINRKKAQMISEKLQGMSDLQAMANAYNSKVDTATNVTFQSAYIQSAGAAEPVVVAKAFKVDLNQLSEPIEGIAGVYVVKPTNKPAVAASNVAQARQTSQQTARISVRGQLVPSLRENADITDNRSRFF